MDPLTLQSVEDLNNLLVLLRDDSKPDPSYLIDIYNIALMSLYRASNEMVEFYETNAGITVVSNEEVKEKLEEDQLIDLIGVKMINIHQKHIAQYSDYPNFKYIMY